MSKFLTVKAGFFIPGKELGIDKLVAVATDGIKVVREVGAAAKDGIQFADAFIVFNQFPAIQAIGQNAKQAFRELRNLNPAEAAEFAQRVSDNTGLPNDGSILGKVRAALALAARTYKVVDDAVAVGYEWVNLFDATGAVETEE